MTASSTITNTTPVQATTPPSSTDAETEKILCQHCLRTATNGIKCKGICVADDDY
ncbi:MAG: hypothetical protein F6J87_01665 [Spirulina sp. SIO3F2]|nr:hypothetical protein [Spirulina sp. SIO3F2]